MNPSLSSASKGFDFGSDDVLCPYIDYDASVNHHQPPPPPIKAELRQSASGRSLAGNAYCEEGYNSEVISTVEKGMRKYSNNLFSFLEGINGRLSQLESFCSNVEQDVNEFHSDLAHKYNEENLKFIDLMKHLQEVQRSVQIMRDRQELADTQKELSNMQLVQKDYPDVKHTDAKTEAAAVSTPETTKFSLPDPSNFSQKAQNAIGYALLPNQTATLVSLPSVAADQNMAYKQVPFQQVASSNLPPAKPTVDFQKQASTSHQLYHYTQVQSNVPYHAHYSYQTRHEAESSGFQNPQTLPPYQNESNSRLLPYNPQQQQWVSPGPQPQFSRPQEQTDVRNDMPPPSSVSFYSYHVPAAQHTMSAATQQVFPQQLVSQSSGVSQPSPGNQTEERSGHGGNYGDYRYPSASTSNYQQQMQPPPLHQANPNEISLASHQLSPPYARGASKMVYDADHSRHPYSYYYQQQNRQ